MTDTPTTKEKLAYEAPVLTTIDATDGKVEVSEHWKTSSRRMTIMNGLKEGQRVSFASHETLEAMLEVGYLELEGIVQGTTVHQLVLKLGEKKYQFSMHNAGERAAFRPFEVQRVQDITARVDLHAFRWYANG